MATKKKTTRKAGKKSVTSSSGGVIVVTDKASKSLLVYVVDAYQYQVKIEAKRTGGGPPLHILNKCFWDGNVWICSGGKGDSAKGSSAKGKKR